MDTRQTLKEAIGTGEVLTIVYFGGTQPGTQRQIAPVGLIGEHVRAIALPQEEIRTYFVDKIEVVGEAHDAPDYDPKRSPSRGAGKQRESNARTISIELDLDSSAASESDEGLLTHAVAGSFGATHFIDEETGRFRFPKYDTGSDSLVRVRDKTRYNRENFSSPEDIPLAEYTIDDFERDFLEAEFDVPPIGCLFKQKNKKHFSPFDYLARAMLEVDAFVACMENRKEHPFVPADSRVFASIEKDGFAESVAISRADALELLDSKYKKPELVEIAKKHGIAAKGLKSELIERLFDSGTLEPDKALVPTERFESLVVALVDVYLADIRTSTDHFHPLFFESLWHEVRDANWSGWAYLEARIEAIQREPYWLDRLELPGYAKQPPKRWWQFWR